MSKTRRQRILDTLSDAVADLLFYDRKEDEGLPVGAIEASISDGEITKDEMVKHFVTALEKSLP